MNVLTFAILPWKYHWRKNIAQIPHNIKFAYQRAVKGYAKCDLWNLDIFYTEQFISTLKGFKELKYGCPGNISKQNWDLILDYLIDGFSEVLKWQEGDIEYNLESKESIVEINNYYRTYRRGLLYFLGLIYDYLWE